MLGNNAIARIFEHCGLMTDLGLIISIHYQNNLDYILMICILLNK